MNHKGVVVVSKSLGKEWNHQEVRILLSSDHQQPYDVVLPRTNKRGFLFNDGSGHLSYEEVERQEVAESEEEPSLVVVMEKEFDAVVRDDESTGVDLKASFDSQQHKYQERKKEELIGISETLRSIKRSAGIPTSPLSTVGEETKSDLSSTPSLLLQSQFPQIMCFVTESAADVGIIGEPQAISWSLSSELNVTDQVFASPHPNGKLLQINRTGVYHLQAHVLVKSNVVGFELRVWFQYNGKDVPGCSFANVANTEESAQCGVCDATRFLELQEGGTIAVLTQSTGPKGDAVLSKTHTFLQLVMVSAAAKPREEK